MVTPVANPELEARIRLRLASLTKPPGSLGRLEELALQVGLIQGTDEPRVGRKAMLLFCADHGVAVDEGVSPYPPEVTGQMVANFRAGGAAITVLCRQYGIEPVIVDMGVGKPTRNFAREAAMSRADAEGVLAALGGFEIAAIVGLILGAAERRRVVVLDGFISCSAALVVRAMEPAALDYVVYSHRSAERGHRRMLEALSARPLLDLDMRLGEGTGAAIGINLVESAVRLYREMATFVSAGISTDATSIDEVPPPESRSGAVQ